MGAHGAFPFPGKGKAPNGWEYGHGRGRGPWLRRTVCLELGDVAFKPGGGEGDEQREDEYDGRVAEREVQPDRDRPLAICSTPGNSHCRHML